MKKSHRKLLASNNFRTYPVHVSAAGAIEWTHLMCHSATWPGGDAAPPGCGLSLGLAGRPRREVYRASPGPAVWHAAALRCLAVFLLFTGVLAAQAPAGIHADWRRIGNSGVELALASPASGPVDRVWYSVDGSTLFVRTSTGQVFETADFENWRPGSAVAPEPDASLDGRAAGQVRASRATPLQLYSFGSQVLRSDDGGLSWANLTLFEGRSILGAEARDVAVSPRDPEEVTVAAGTGVWRSLDGGLSWTGLNETLPNLPIRRIAAVPRDVGGVRLFAGDLGVIEWAPGEKQAWRTVPDPFAIQDAAARNTLSRAIGAEVTAFASAGDLVYAGSADGRLWVSSDRGRTWNSTLPAERGAVEAIYSDPKEPRLALAALGPAPRGAAGPRVLRTVNAGQFWDDLTGDLPASGAHGITADRTAGAVYAATTSGLFYTRTDLNAPVPATPWSAVAGLPPAAAMDVKLDPDGNQLFVAIEGYGVYAALAPHRLASPRLVNAADFSQRAAAPGSLLSFLGGRVKSARAGDLSFPVLAASDAESQIQVPFAAPAGSLSLSLDTAAGDLRLAVPLETASPAIFVDRDGTPLVLNADTGVLLDGMNTARSGGRLQILATGLGRVRPEWPAGVPGPLDNPPQVVVPVRAYLDRAPVEVTRSVLAPGYVGLYLVEVRLPAIVNAGSAELYLESENQQSNRVRVWIEP